MSTNNRIPEHAENIFQQNDPLYEKIGLSPRRWNLAGKSHSLPAGRNIQAWRPNSAQELRNKYPNASIGLLAGTTLPNGNLVGFLDGDHSGFNEFLCRATNAVSGKIGQKGITVFCQFEPGTKSKKTRQKGASAPILEIMASSGMTVLPPSPHPSGSEYRWHGKPLYDVAPNELPLVGSEQLTFISEVCQHSAALAIVDGGPDVKAHDLMLALTASGIAMLDLELPWMAHLPERAAAERAIEETRPKKRSECCKALARKSWDRATVGATAYDPGSLGPIPLGYLSDGRFVFFEQPRRLLIVETSTRLMNLGTLVNLAPIEFWSDNFPSEKGINATGAGLALMEAARLRGGFDESRVRGRGVYIENGEVVRNFGGEIPRSARFAYVCPIPAEH